MYSKVTLVALASALGLIPGGAHGRAAPAAPRSSAGTLVLAARTNETHNSSKGGASSGRLSGEAAPVIPPPQYTAQVSAIQRFGCSERQDSARLLHRRVPDDTRREA